MSLSLLILVSWLLFKYKHQFSSDIGAITETEPIWKLYGRGFRRRYVLQPLENPKPHEQLLRLDCLGLKWRMILPLCSFFANSETDFAGSLISLLSTTMFFQFEFRTTKAQWHLCRSGLGRDHMKRRSC